MLGGNKVATLAGNFEPILAGAARSPVGNGRSISSAKRISKGAYEASVSLKRRPRGANECELNRRTER